MICLELLLGFEKAPYSIIFTDDGMVIDDKLSQSLNASLPMRVTEFGMTIDARFSHR